VGICSLISAIFLPAEFPQSLTPFLVVFGVGFIAMAIPARILKKLPEWFTRDDSWM
jgi:ABC-type antimicrobial peptide transport system permease subunit